MEDADSQKAKKILVKAENIIKNLVKNYFYGIYDRDTYIVLMKKFEVLKNDLQNYLVNPTSINHSVAVSKIKNLSQEIGCLSLFDILDIIYDNWFDMLDVFDLSYHELQFFNIFFNPLNYKSSNDVNLTLFENKGELKRIILRTDTGLKFKKSLVEQINSAELLILLDDGNDIQQITIYGYFLEDNMNFAKNNMMLNPKYNACKSILGDGINKVKLNLLDIVPIKDMIILDTHEIIKSVNNSYNELLAMRLKPLSVKVKDFLISSLKNQRHMLNLLLCSDVEEDMVVANLLYDTISKNTEISKAHASADELFKSFHFSIQDRLKSAHKTFENLKKRISGDGDIEIPYDKRIMMMNTTDNIKKKAIQKLKEMDGSRENSTKAQNYLDGLLKIPFGVNKKEPIFCQKDTYLAKLKAVMNGFKDKIEKFRESILYKECFIELNSLFVNFITSNIKYDSEIEAFLEKCRKSILEVNNMMKDIVLLDTRIKHSDLKPDSVIKFGSDLNHLDSSPLLKSIVDKKSNEIKEAIEMLENLDQEWNKFVLDKEKYLLEVDKTLDEAVYGHKESKKDLKRLLGQWINGSMEGNVIGLCGPPGVGKTSFAKRGLSKCLKDENGKSRPFAFLPIGGATNGSFLEGHGYTYLGSTWGKIADVLMDSGCMNPIIFIDELDKVSNTEHGKEIIGILTHITDPTQNHEYYDKFFTGIPIDLSKALFVFSYNDRSLVDRILRDRIHEIQIKPLSRDDKLYITKNYTFPEISEKVGFSNKDLIFEDGVIELIIDSYTNEAGIRKLNELLYEIFREVNLDRLSNPKILPKTINKNFIERMFLDKPKVRPDEIHKKPLVGLVNGLYASATGIGGLTPVEVVKTFGDSKLGLELTGQMGDVMKESMKCAKTLAWNILPQKSKEDIKSEMDKLGGFGLHIHCPEASVPKDGPSAGVTITTAIISRLTGIKVKNTVAMTGEIDLHGRVHAIGGLDAKSFGAFKAGVTDVICPKENEEDYNKILRERKPLVKFHLVETIEEVLKIALCDNDLEFVFDWN